MVIISESLGETTKVSMIVSFIINLVLSGPMDFLWGFLNSLQILTYLPLIDVMMPANAYQMFLVMK